MNRNDLQYLLCSPGLILTAVDQQTLDSVTPTPTLDSMRPRPITYTIISIIHTDVCLPHTQTGSKLNVRIIIFHNISLQRLTLDIPWYPLVSLGSCPEILKSPMLTFIPARPLSVTRCSSLGCGLGLSTDIDWIRLKFALYHTCVLPRISVLDQSTNQSNLWIYYNILIYDHIGNVTGLHPHKRCKELQLLRRRNAV